MTGQTDTRILALHWFNLCSPWRINVPLNALRNVGYEVREASIHERVDDALDVDLLVMHRPATMLSLRLIDEARRRGTRIVVDVDDLFLPDVLQPNSPAARAWHPLFHRWDAEARAAAGVDSWECVARAPRNDMMELLHQCLEAADAVTVTTYPLATAYQAFNPKVYVLPNCYDDAEPLWNLGPAARPTVHLGFAGTLGHDDNLAPLVGALEPVLRAHPEVRVVEAGGPALLPLIDAPSEQLVHLGSVAFKVFPLVLQQMDVVLAPLADVPFTRCKSNIRCMTAGLLGLPVVASPVGAYAEYVEHGVNGFLARTPEEWTDYLERLVVDPERRWAMGAANRERARNYAISRNFPRWVGVYESLLGCRCRA